eukprot:SAG11_NODE_502_length_8891_cov_4.603731_2_plen_220_part_00
MNFLGSSEQEPQCEPVFLGPDIGLVSVFEYHDDDGTCQLSMTELAAVCSDYFQECMAFLDSSEQEPQCEQVFLGPDIGFVSVFEYHDDDGTCQLSMTELATVCADYFAECVAFLDSSECEPGLDGLDCSIDIQECDSEPCLNGATCTDGANVGSTPQMHIDAWNDQYTCACSSGWEGENCATDINECSDGLNPCVMGSACSETEIGGTISAAPSCPKIE